MVTPRLPAFRRLAAGERVYMAGARRLIGGGEVLPEAEPDSDVVGPGYVPPRGPLAPDVVDEARRVADACAAVLSDYEARVFWWRFEGRSLVAIAESVRPGRAVSRERIRQVEANAVRKLRMHFSALDLNV